MPFDKARLETESSHSPHGGQRLAHEGTKRPATLPARIAVLEHVGRLECHGKPEEGQDTEGHEGDWPHEDEGEHDPKDQTKCGDHNLLQWLPGLCLEPRGIARQLARHGANSVLWKIKVARLLPQVSGEHEVSHSVRQVLRGRAKAVEHSGAPQEGGHRQRDPSVGCLHDHTPHLEPRRLPVLLAGLVWPAQLLWDEGGSQGVSRGGNVLALQDRLEKDDDHF
mmetsp:Transcript_8846/g.26710  ORF Transcript_8846/g.26710 Transcript_8846/m.26710 type:complete len:223 (+) Transcript_8846:1877-2545(+)